MSETLTVSSEARLTQKGNLKETRYGWLRLTPAFSVHLVNDLLDREPQAPGPTLDPFGGTGTTALVCAERGVPSYTADINPFLVWLTTVKTARYSADDVDELYRASVGVDAAIQNMDGQLEWFPSLHQIEKWWDTATLHALGRAMAHLKATEVSPKVSNLLLLAFCRTSIARASVSFGHQSMSFKRKKEGEKALSGRELVDLTSEAWTAAIRMIGGSAQSAISRPPRVELCDARQLAGGFGDGQIGRVITSPPYPNRMSYVRELRPYMYWLGYLSDGRAAGELDWQAIGGTWGSATSNVGKWTPSETRHVPHLGFDEILERISERSDLLSRYVHKYFFDMLEHVAAVKKILVPGGSLHYIVGNSKFYDVLLPVEQIYAGMFEEAGFTDVKVETIRKRSSKRELFEFVVSARQPA
jgi:DNA modification methylase